MESKKKAGAVGSKGVKHFFVSGWSTYIEGFDMGRRV